MMAAKMICVNDEEMIRMAFRVLDKKGEGHLETSSFKHLMTKIGNQKTDIKGLLQSFFLDSGNIFPGEGKLTEKEVDDLIAEADVNNDGDIDYEEFVKMLTII